MKKNENKKKIKDYQSKLSPSLQRKKYFFSKNLFKDFEHNNILLSPKKSQDELLLPKKKVIPNTSHHRRTKSNSQNYIEYMTNKNIILNETVSKLSFIFGKKELENNYNYSSVSRNKKSKNNLNENKKSSNLLSISFSLKDFRNNIINVFSNSNIYESKNNNNNKNSNIINLKNNKSVFNFDISNIEETRNTTSITNMNNYNKLISNKDKEKENSKSSKYIKISQKYSKALYSSKNNSSKIITFTNNNSKIEKYDKKSPKYNLQRYIKNSNNINVNNSKLNNANNLILTKNALKNSKKFLSQEKVFNINPISEFKNVDNIDIIKKKKTIIKNNFSPTDKSMKIRKMKKDRSHKYKKRNTKSQDNKSQDNYCKNGINCNNTIGEFKSVEEIHFIFVYINQKKKEFFENNLKEKDKKE